jgi:benzodiazapine receptor
LGRFLLNLIATILVVAVNALANILPINGQSTGAISNKLGVLFTPAGYVFSIWGLIYLLLFVWVLREFPADRRNLPLYKEATPVYVLSSLLNILWIFSWHYEYFLVSVVVMLGLLFTLIALYHKVRAASFWDMVPFSIYLGWVSVATIANISYYLVSINWDGFGLPDQVWTLLMLGVATLLAIIFSFKKSDPYFASVFTWAFIGIGVRNATPHPSISYSAYFLAAAILIFALTSNKNHLTSLPKT